MKSKYMIILIAVLVILVGAYVISPFSPMNKVSINGETIKLSSGYTVENSSENSLIISNGTSRLKIYKTNDSTDLEAAMVDYKEGLKKYDVTYEKLNDTPKEIYKTTAIPKKGNYTVTGYWFVSKDKTFKIITTDNQTATQQVAIDIIKSM